MEFDIEFAIRLMPDLLRALTVTLWATAGGSLIAAVLGLLWAVLRYSNAPLGAFTSRFSIEFLRSTPLLVQIYFLFYVLPGVGLSMSPMTTGILALGLHYSAYMAEVFRAGIEGVPRGQWEAARALNLPRVTIWTRIVLPQSIPPMIPAMGNYLIAMFKDTPMLSAITVLELLQTAKVIGSESFRYLEPLTLVGVLFLVISLGASLAIRCAEARFMPHETFA